MYGIHHLRVELIYLIIHNIFNFCAIMLTTTNSVFYHTSPDWYTMHSGMIIPIGVNTCHNNNPSQNTYSNN